MNRASSKPPSFCFSDAKGLEIRLHSRYRVEVNRRSSLVERSSSMRGIEACQKKKSRTESKHIPEKRRAKSSSKHSRINSGKNTACKKEVVVEKRSASKHGYSLVTGSKSIVTRHSLEEKPSSISKASQIFAGRKQPSMH